MDDGSEWTQSKNKVYQRKENGTSFWSIALRSRHFGSSSFEWSLLEDSISPTEKQFILMADDASRDCRVRIIEAQLCVKYVKLPDKKYRDIQQFLLATSACYSIKRVVMKTHSVAQGISSLNWVNTHVGQLPNSVYGCGG